MFFGDSLVNGTGDPACLGWAGRVGIDAWRKGKAVTYYNLGVRAENSRKILTRWEAECLPRLLDGHEAVLFFSFGTGDSALDNGKRRVPLNETVDNVENILSRARELGTVLFVGPPPVLDEGHTARSRETSVALGAACARLGVPFLDPMPGLSESALYMRDLEDGDGVHPGAGGYLELAGLVNAWEDWGKVVGA
jgi:lysophospholipase L1-like esterase